MTRIDRFAVGRARITLALAALSTAALLLPSTARPALPADAVTPLQAVAAQIGLLPVVAAPAPSPRASAAALRLQRIPRAQARAALRRAERRAGRDLRVRRLLAARPGVERGQRRCSTRSGSRAASAAG